MTLEQLWHVATVEPGDVDGVDGVLGTGVRRTSEALDAPRRAMSRARAGDLSALAALAAGGGIAVASAVVRRSRRSGAGVNTPCGAGGVAPASAPGARAAR